MSSPLRSAAVCLLLAITLSGCLAFESDVEDARREQAEFDRRQTEAVADRIDGATTTEEMVAHVREAQGESDARWSSRPRPARDWSTLILEVLGLGGGLAATGFATYKKVMKDRDRQRQALGEETIKTARIPLIPTSP